MQLKILVVIFSLYCVDESYARGVTVVEVQALTSNTTHSIGYDCKTEKSKFLSYQYVFEDISMLDVNALSFYSSQNILG